MDILIGSATSNNFHDYDKYHRLITANSSILRVSHKAKNEIHWCLGNSTFFSDDEIWVQPRANNLSQSASFELRKDKISSIRGRHCTFLYVNSNKEKQEIIDRLSELDIFYEHLFIKNKNERNRIIFCNFFLKSASHRAECWKHCSRTRYLRSLITKNIPAAIKPSTGIWSLIYANKMQPITCLATDGVTFLQDGPRYAKFGDHIYQHNDHAHYLDKFYLNHLCKNWTMAL